MKKRFDVRVALATAFAAVTATAWATTETLKLVPSTTIPTVVLEEHELKAAAPLRTEDTLAPNETVIAIERPAPVLHAPSRPAPVGRTAVAQPPIVIEEKAMSPDERIQSEVMDHLAYADNLSGRIGVESHDAVVTLTGYTVTAAQAQRAERMARSVDGVRGVDNRIRARIGGSV